MNNKIINCKILIRNHTFNKFLSQYSVYYWLLNNTFNFNDKYDFDNYLILSTCNLIDFHYDKLKSCNYIDHNFTRIYILNIFGKININYYYSNLNKIKKYSNLVHTFNDNQLFYSEKDFLLLMKNNIYKKLIDLDDKQKYKMINSKLNNGFYTYSLF